MQIEAIPFDACPSCGDPLPHYVGLCRACRETGEAAPPPPIFDARRMAQLRWKNWRLFAALLSTLSDAQLQRQAEAYIAWLRSYQSPLASSEATPESVSAAWRGLMLLALST
jgi:hypothetical protein